MFSKTPRRKIGKLEMALLAALATSLIFNFGFIGFLRLGNSTSVILAIPTMIILNKLFQRARGESG